jgi:hypothetical protein
VFLTKIFEHLASNPLTSHISRPSIIAAGATHLNRLVDNAEALAILRNAYSLGIRDTMIVALVAIALGLLCLPGMEWLKLQNTDAKEDEEALAIAGEKEDVRNERTLSQMSLAELSFDDVSLSQVLSKHWSTESRKDSAASSIF